MGPLTVSYAFEKNFFFCFSGKIPLKALKVLLFSRGSHTLFKSDKSSKPLVTVDINREKSYDCRVPSSALLKITKF